MIVVAATLPWALAFALVVYVSLRRIRRRVER